MSEPNKFEMPDRVIEVLIICATILSIVFVGDPDICDAIIKNLMTF